MNDLVAPWQVELGGVLLGRDTRYRIRTAPTGLGSPVVRVADVGPLSRDGIYAAGDWAGERVVSWGLVVLGDSPGHTEQLVNELAGAWQPSRSDLELRYRLADDRTYVLAGRPRRCEVDFSVLKYGHAFAAVQFVATDPRRYDATVRVATIPLGSGDPSGFTFPLVFPLTFQDPGTPPSGLVRLTNDGTTPTWPTIAITGAVENPIVENATTGQRVTLDLTVGANDVVEVDMGRRTVRLNGANRLGARVAGSEFWPVVPGTNLVGFRSVTTLEGATATVTYRSAWM